MYAIDASAPVTTTIGLLRNWYGRANVSNGWRWAASPAELYVAAPQRTLAFLELRLSFIHDPASADGLGPTGVLLVDDGSSVAEVPIRVGELARVPVVLPAGAGTIRLTLAAGNFSPRQYGGTDESVYSFAVSEIHLRTLAILGAQPDLLIAGQQQDSETRMLSFAVLAIDLAPGPGAGGAVGRARGYVIMAARRLTWADGGLMSVEYRHGKTEPGSVAVTPAARLALPHLGLIVTAGLVLVTALLLARPLAAAYYLGAGSRALEAARSSPERAAQLDRAVHDLAQARALSPREPLVYRRLAEAALLQGRPDEAVAALEVALSLEPTSLLIRRELIYAAIDLGQLDQAAALIGELRRSAGDLVDVADAEVRAGQLERAFELYRDLIAAAPQPQPALLLRAALTGAALDKTAEAVGLLRASGAPEPLELILAAVEPATKQAGLLAPPELKVFGYQQEIAAATPLFFFGQGWYPYEPGFGRWAGPQAELVVFSPVARRVELNLAIHTLYDPASPTLFGETGTLIATINGGPATVVDAYGENFTAIPLNLPAGWSVVRLRLGSGSFQPAALTGNGDQRELSFALVAAVVLP